MHSYQGRYSVVFIATISRAVIFVLFCFVEEEDENDLQNRSLTPYPFLCPEFWQHYNYLMEFHDRHTNRKQEQQPSQEMRATPNRVITPAADVAQHLYAADVMQSYTAHVLNTIDEEESAEDDNRPCKAAGTDKSDSENEVTVMITLPAKMAAGAGRGTAETTDSPVDFWQQINEDEDEDGGGRDEATAATTVADDRDATSTTSDGDSCSEDSSESSCEDSCKLSDDGSAASSCLEDAKSSTSCSEDAKSSSSADGAAPPQVSGEDAGLRGDNVVQRRKSEEDVDSGVTALSTDISRQPSEKDVRVTKKYQRTCTHSRLFDFLQRDDGCGNRLLQLQSADMLSSCTSGYSSAATTPTMPSSVCKNKYESESARTEYDSYYQSWEYACPYFGYDIMPSKAFKTIMQGGGGGTSPSTKTKFKCPKISASADDENEDS